MGRKRLGEVLRECRLISEAQLTDALQYQNHLGGRLGAALVARGHLTETQLVQVLGGLLQIPVVDLRVEPMDSEAIECVPGGMAAKHGLFPIRLRTEGGQRVLTVAMRVPQDRRAQEELAFLTECRVVGVLARASDIDSAIRRTYGRGGDPTPDEPIPLTVKKDPANGMAWRPSAARKPRAEAVTQKAPRPSSDEVRALMALERKFQALLRLLIRRGLVNPTDFARELDALSPASAKRGPSKKGSSS